MLKSSLLPARRTWLPLILRVRRHDLRIPRTVYRRSLCSAFPAIHHQLCKIKIVTIRHQSQYHLHYTTHISLRKLSALRQHCPLPLPSRWRIHREWNSSTRQTLQQVRDLCHATSEIKLWSTTFGSYNWFCHTLSLCSIIRSLTCRRNLELTKVMLSHCVTL